VQYVCCVMTSGDTGGKWYIQMAVYLFRSDGERTGDLFGGMRNEGCGASEHMKRSVDVARGCRGRGGWVDALDGLVFAGYRLPMTREEALATIGDPLAWGCCRPGAGIVENDGWLA
jgi:hypothetical protein